jgi:prefoldin subunit 5
MFRRLIAWLNKRFPEQYVVTAEEYKQLREELAQYNVLAQNMNLFNTRITTLENHVRQLNNANGFVTSAKGAFSLER